MPNVSENAVYNARIPHMRVPSPRFLAITFVVLCVLLCAPVRATDFRTPEEQLSRKIAAVTGPGALVVNIVNRSSVAQAEFEQIRRGVLNELALVGVRAVGAEQSAGAIEISLSENLREYVWVAEIHQGSNEVSIVMVTTPRPDSTVMPEHPATSVVIHKTLLWTDDNRILDVATVSTNPLRVAFLEPQGVMLVTLQSGHWQQEQSLPIEHLHPWPRDLRGRLILRKDHLFDAYLPGIFCRSTANVPLALSCFESDDPWPLAPGPGLSAFFTPNRNYFTGALSPGIEKQTTTKPFYSAAMLPRDKYKLWIFTGVDGQVHLLDGASDQTLPQSEWGSDIAGTQSACGTGWQVLVTGNRDKISETVQAFEVPDRELVPVSQSIEFGGHVTALWSEADGATAIAVAQNSQTGKYEAYRLSITCAQ